MSTPQIPPHLAHLTHAEIIAQAKQIQIARERIRREAEAHKAAKAKRDEQAVELAQTEILTQYEHDPVGFAIDVLGIKHIWKKQREFLEAVADPSVDHVAVRSGQKTGKTDGLAILGLWWPKTRRDGRVIATSSVALQVRQIIWRTVTRLYHQAARNGRPLGGTLHMTPQMGLQWQDGRQFIGFTAGDSEAAGGWSGANQLFLIDEGSGVGDATVEAFEGNLAGGGKIVMAGNPLRTAGVYYRAFYGTERVVWRHVHISSEDSPNITGAEPAIPGLAAPRWLENRRAACGTDYTKHPAYQARVLGQFPTQSAFAIVSLDAVETAKQRGEEDFDAVGILDVGVDVARYGDDATVIVGLRGNRQIGMVKLHSMDGPTVAAHVREVIFGKPGGDRGWVERGVDGRPVERPRVKVDVIGYGASAYDQLKSGDGLDCYGVNVAEKPTSRPLPGMSEFAQLRDQLWFAIADWLKAGGSLHPGNAPELESDLVGAEYGIARDGKMKVMTKEVMKEKFGHSPDEADALALAIYTPPPNYTPPSDLGASLRPRTDVVAEDDDWDDDR